MLTLIIWVIMGIITALVAEKRGRRSWLWAIIGLLTGVFGLLVMVMMPRKNKKQKNEEVQG